MDTCHPVVDGENGVREGAREGARDKGNGAWEGAVENGDVRTHTHTSASA